MADTAQQAATPTPINSGGAAPSGPGGSVASSAVRQTMRGYDYDRQIQMLAPRSQASAGAALRTHGPETDDGARPSPGGGRRVQRLAVQRDEPDRSMPDGSASDGDASYPMPAQGEAPAAGRAPRQAGNPAAQRIDRVQTVTSVDGLRSSLGEMVLAGLPNIGAMVNGNVTIRVAIEGMVFTFELELTGERKNGDTIECVTRATIGVGGGDAARNVGLLSPTTITSRGMPANARAVGSGIALGLRERLAHAGEGDVPDDFLVMLFTLAGGVVGQGVLVGDRLVRFWRRAYGGGSGNPSYAWLADRLFGAGFRAEACADLGEDASVETRRGIAIEGRASETDQGGGRSISGRGRAQRDEVRTVECGPDGESSERTTNQGTGTLELTVGGINAQISIRGQPQPEIKIRFRLRMDDVDFAGAILTDLVSRALGRANDWRQQRGGRPIPLSEASLAFAWYAAFARLPGPHRVEASIEVKLSHAQSSLRLVLADGLRGQQNGEQAQVEATLARGQVIEVPIGG